MNARHLLFDRVSCGSRVRSVGLAMALALTPGLVEAATLVAPNEFAEQEDPDGQSGAFKQSARVQNVYAARHFPAQPIVISELRFRRDVTYGVGPFTNELASVRVVLSTTPKLPGTLVGDFSQNIGPDPLVVFEGNILLSSASTSPPGKPNPFEIAIPFSTPFRYDPAQGSLLVDFSNFEPTAVGSVDASNELSDDASRAFAFDANAAFAPYVDTGADVIQFVYSLAPPPPYYKLTLATLGGGIIVPDPVLSGYLSGAKVRLTAQPASGWAFLDWAGTLAGTEPAATVTMSHDRLIKARFGTSISTEVQGQGFISVIPAASDYPFGSTVTITAEPQPGYVFTGWSGALSGDSNPRRFVVGEPKPKLIATFAPAPAGHFVLTVAPNGYGRVTRDPQANHFAGGESVTLTAVPDADQEFLGWSGDASGAQNPIVLLMDRNRVVYAQFTKRARLSIDSQAASPTPGGLLISVAGDPAATYSIESSPDLRDWTHIQTVVTRNSEAYILVIPAGPADTRSYRANGPR